ncbi:RING-type domain-containing protein [Haematococcus lacustris]|uniref:RING-type domain-containing protein n=1 Tax=Haematococcus lacustris TaxID=44745 RepID=A0A699YJW6_HAELA|nr:RING-type domain-containing protein [Haematococcus lacustris]
MAVLQAELDLVRGQRGSAQAKVQEVQQEAERLGAQRELLTATIEPLEGEVAKLELLLQGVAESA